MNMIKNLQILESEISRICLNPNPASLPHLKDDRLQLSNVCQLWQQGSIFRFVLSHLELTQDHVLQAGMLWLTIRVF